MVVTTTRTVSVNSQAPPAVRTEASAALSTAALPAAWRETCSEPVKVKQPLLSAVLISCLSLRWKLWDVARCLQSVKKVYEKQNFLFPLQFRLLADVIVQ